MKDDYLAKNNDVDEAEFSPNQWAGIKTTVSNIHKYAPKPATTHIIANGGSASALGGHNHVTGVPPNSSYGMMLQPQYYGPPTLYHQVAGPASAFGGPNALMLAAPLQPQFYQQPQPGMCLYAQPTVNMPLANPALSDHGLYGAAPPQSIHPNATPTLSIPLANPALSDRGVYGAPPQSTHPNVTPIPPPKTSAIDQKPI